MPREKLRGIPIEGSAKPIPREEWEALGLDFGPSEQTLKELEALRRIVPPSALYNLVLD